MTNQESINKFLTEKFLGGCWHEAITDDFEYQGAIYQYLRCEHCGKDWLDITLQNLFTWEGFGILWEKAQEQEWFEDFNSTRGGRVKRVMQCSWNLVKTDLINPQTFPIILAEFLGYKEGE
jgi:hypothetical protein